MSPQPKMQDDDQARVDREREVGGQDLAQSNNEVASASVETGALSSRSGVWTDFTPRDDQSCKDMNAFEHVVYDLHAALGVRWGDDPYGRIRQLREAEGVLHEALREFAGWLSADIPELHAVEVPRLAESLVRFLARRQSGAWQPLPVPPLGEPDK